MTESCRNYNKSGFTIVELLVVIVVIGILAAITVIAYNGISSKAIATSLLSDLNNASKQLKLYNTLYGSYPTLNSSNCPSAPIVDNIYCLKPSPDTVFHYNVDNTVSPQSFVLTATKSGISYIIANGTIPTLISTTASSLNCPTGFIPVPGSITYGTGDFCVMKYEAKNVNGIATSQAASTPWTFMSQIAAVTASSAACSGCHLITEAEWMTLAQNVVSVSSNWRDGVVGISTNNTNYIYSGHNDNFPNHSIAASGDDTDGYYGTNNNSSDSTISNVSVNGVLNSVIGKTQRRTLALTNGEIIWDMSGNVLEWTAGQITGGQPGIIGESSFSRKEWSAATVNGNLAINPFPSNANPLADNWLSGGSSNWATGAQGIGALYSCAGNVSACNMLQGFIRSNAWNRGNTAGIFSLSLISLPTAAASDFGFRVAR